MYVYFYADKAYTFNIFSNGSIYQKRVKKTGCKYMLLYVNFQQNKVIIVSCLKKHNQQWEMSRGKLKTRVEIKYGKGKLRTNNIFVNRH